MSLQPLAPRTSPISGASFRLQADRMPPLERAVSPEAYLVSKSRAAKHQLAPVLAPTNWAEDDSPGSKGKWASGGVGLR